MPRVAAFQNSYRGLIGFAMLLWVFAGSEICQRAAIRLKGTVVSSETTCVQPENNRCATQYVIEEADHSRTTYIAGPTDKALQRRLPVGTTLQKDRWALAYTINGKKVADFPIGFYGGLIFAGFFCIGWFLLLSARSI